jgi:hypothetical protein
MPAKFDQQIVPPVAMRAREREAHLFARCAKVAGVSGVDGQALDQCEANVFRVAGMVLRSQWPQQAARLLAASEDYFARFPDQRLAAEQVVRRGWLISLPRLRVGLNRLLRKG